MGMRRSDATFLSRDILPILRRAASISPDAEAAAEMLTERLAEPYEDEDYAVTHVELVEWAVRPLRLMVDGQEVPFIDGMRLDDGSVSLTLDRRFGIVTTEDELNRWAWFVARCMLVAAQRSAHGDRWFTQVGEVEEDRGN
jgi:hypothetical protein